MLSCPERLYSGATKPITFFYISMHNSSVFVFTTLQELTCHRSQGIMPTYLYLSSAHLIWSIQPPHVQTKPGYYASSADRKQGTGKLKSQETKEVAGEWKNKWWLPPSPGVRGHVACHLGVLVRSGAVMMCWAGPVQNRVKGTGVTGS